MGDDVVAERLDGSPRERLVDAFDFLQADDVGRASFSQVSEWSIRCRIELTFHVAMRMEDQPSRTA